MQLKRTLLAIATIATASGPALAAGPGEYTLHIRGVVPTVCRATLDNSVIPSDRAQVALGKLNEFCNSPNGYRIYADHSPELADSRMSINGKQVQLSKSGSTLLVQSDTPAKVSRNLVLHLAKGGTAGNLSFRIVPL
jgi:type 1 fimbria pilin